MVCELKTRLVYDTVTVFPLKNPALRGFLPLPQGEKPPYFAARNLNRAA
jgi:hypothetical protein